MAATLVCSLPAVNGSGSEPLTWMQARLTKNRELSLDRVAPLDDAFRTGVRRCIEEAEFHEAFKDRDQIRAEWPVPTNS